MKKIIHGGDIYSYKTPKDIIDFSANINPLGIPQSVKDALHNAVDLSINYPDPLSRKLLKNLALYENVSEANITIGNGAADVIFKLALALKPKKALIISPTFSEYELALKTINCNCQYYILKEENDFNLDENILSYLSEDIDILFLCNPNNPTGVVAKKELLFEILKKCEEKNIMFFIDECFNEFLENAKECSMVNCICSSKNLFILKAFTKIYAIPGVRLGYGICGDSGLINKIDKSGQAWSVSVFAQEAGISALKENEFVKKSVIFIKKQREILKNQLKNLGFKVFQSNANYIFFKNETKIDLKSKLEENNILIRSCENYQGLNNDFYRIAVKDEISNEKLLKVLTEIVKK